MAEAALDLLIRKIRKRRDGEAHAAVDRLVAHELVVRQSAAAPAATKGPV
jgi:DNA-binding LacI/PurR family transcriptional regulator